jgi:D-alanine-D-alanine ligase
MKIGFVYNLRNTYIKKNDDPDDADAEWDSESTIQNLSSTIASLGHTVVHIGSPQNLIFKHQLLEDINLIFNIAEGVHGRNRESQVPAICELLNIPYTFSDALTMAISLDKFLCKNLIHQAGIPTPEYWKITTPDDIATVPGNRFPLFVKPITEGTAKGITIDNLVNDHTAFTRQVTYLLNKYRQPILVEKYLSGREFTISIIGNDNPYVLGIMEIIISDPSQKNVYTFLAKEEYESRCKYFLFNDRDNPLWKKIASIALAVYTAIECRDIARVDVRCDEHENPYFLEINPLPGLHPKHSDFSIIAGMVGRTYKSLIEEILNTVAQRYGM